jgi:hypothetical protein
VSPDVTDVEVAAGVEVAASVEEAAVEVACPELVEVASSA